MTPYSWNCRKITTKSLTKYLHDIYLHLIRVPPLSSCNFKNESLSCSSKHCATGPTGPTGLTKLTGPTLSYSTNQLIELAFGLSDWNLQSCIFFQYGQYTAFLLLALGIEFTSAPKTAGKRDTWLQNVVNFLATWDGSTNTTNCKAKTFSQW